MMNILLILVLNNCTLNIVSKCNRVMKMKKHKMKQLHWFPQVYPSCAINKKPGNTIL